MSFVRPRELVLTHSMKHVFLQSENALDLGGITYNKVCTGLYNLNLGAIYARVCGTIQTHSPSFLPWH